MNVTSLKPESYVVNNRLPCLTQSIAWKCFICSSSLWCNFKLSVGLLHTTLHLQDEGLQDQQLIFYHWTHSLAVLLHPHGQLVFHWCQIHLSTYSTLPVWISNFSFSYMQNSTPTNNHVWFCMLYKTPKVFTDKKSWLQLWWKFLLTVLHSKEAWFE